MKQDIQNRGDVEHLVRTFYDQVIDDDVIGYIFTEVAKVDWDVHLETMFNFWDAVLFQTGGYKGNTVRQHLMVNEKEPLKEEHFDRWLSLWNATVDQHFEGPRAEDAKYRGKMMKIMIMYKIEASQQPGFIQ